MGREGELAVRWVLAHHGIAGNQKADEYAKAATEGRAPEGDVPDGD